MLYKASIKAKGIQVEEVIGYANDDGSLTIQTCDIYQKHLDFDGDMFDGAVYATTKKKAVEALKATIPVDLALARAEVARLEDLLTIVA